MTAPLIELDRVSYRAGSTCILDRVSLAIHAGAPTVVIGPNGSGKTTLLRILMGLTTPDAGSLRANPNQSLPIPKRAIVLQRPVMLRRSVAGNLRFALAQAGVRRLERDSKAAGLLSLVGMSDRRDRPARRLSSGEQQRLAVARALARDPDVLLLDEPTANLDPAATRSLETLITTISDRPTKVILTTHDVAQARRIAGDIVLIHRGQIVEVGPASAFFESPRTATAQRFLAGELLA